MNGVWRELLFVFLNMIAGNAIAQCPLDLGQTTIPPVNNLISHFPLNGNLDNLGNGGQTATNSGAVFVPTQCGQGLSFDGLDDFLLISPTINLDNDFTVTAWIAPNAQVDWMGIFSIREQCATTYRGFSTVEFGIENYNVSGLSNQVNTHQNCTGFSAGDRYTNSSIMIPNNQESFVAVTVENNSSESRIVKLYFNCSEFSTVMTINYPTDQCFATPLNYLTTIGATSSIAGQTNTFDGVIDEVRIYDIALNHEEILDVYQSCLPVTIDVLNYSDCYGDSAIIELFHSEPDVEYQLYNITSGLPVGGVQPGNCSPLIFPTGVVTDTTEFQLTAVNVNSGCSINLDSIITLYPQTNTSYYYDSISLTLCFGDSILINGQYQSTGGVYTDTVSFSAYCDSIFTFNLSVQSLNVLNLGNDTSFCTGDTITLLSNIPGTSFLWQDGSNDSFLNVHQPGLYWLQVSDSCGTYTDTIIVNMSAPFVDLGVDTLICNGDSLNLDATTPMASYIWSNGSINSSIWLNNSGTYFVEINVNGCIASDTVVVNVQNPPFVQLGSDETICEGDLLVISANAQNGQFNWSDGSSGNSISISEPGLYWLQVSNQCGFSYDSIVIEMDSIPVFDLGMDTSLCTGDSLLLDPNLSGYDFLWQNGSVLDHFLVSQEGIYTLSVFSDFCNRTDSIHVYFSEAPFISLGNDTVICEGEQLLLKPNYSSGALFWNSGSSENSIVVQEAGTYAVQVSNSCGVAHDSITVALNDCWCDIYVPNSFTPDGNEYNQNFKPVHKCVFNHYLIEIYNRWGELIWTSYDPEAFWDATYNGNKVQAGIYTYKITYGIVNQETKQITGHVSVLN